MFGTRGRTPKPIDIPGPVAICNVPRPLYIYPPNRHIRLIATVGPALACLEAGNYQSSFLGLLPFRRTMQGRRKIADLPQTATVSRATTAADIFNGPILTCSGGQNRLKVNNIGSNVQTAWDPLSDKRKRNRKTSVVPSSRGLIVRSDLRQHGAVKPPKRILDYWKGNLWA